MRRPLPRRPGRAGDVASTARHESIPLSTDIRARDIDRGVRSRTHSSGRTHMVRIRSGWLAAIAAVGLVTGACKKNDDKTAHTGSGATTTTTTTTSGDKATPVAVAGADDLSLLPVDSEMVMGLNFAQLQTSALWKQFSPKLMEKAATGLAEFKVACGFDPLEAVKSVSMGLKGLGGAQPDGVIVVHGPEKAKVMACVGKAKEEAAKKGTDITVDGDVFIVKDKSGQPSAFTF